ncbi:methionyl-tRNA formyltransferase [Streptomyces bingchenggensis BCW-1]|uniref:Methionyl-tRNA formyltransferase n=1 Tax=Streptomyces bingchenggensis (strain BCW-1) TaxID=749414 RepID=D7C8A0_STRBB|nr:MULTISPECIES: formyltransferase family protein [Streptomyces]ADI06289.1 methionyl-tRNA formyltransferase [Streptomyces bingchenggensis BCW-1]
MSELHPIRVVLFSEVNSKLGSPFLSILAEHPLVQLVGVVTSPPGKLCPYFIGEEDQVDLEKQASERGIPVFRAAKVNDPAVISELAALEPDYFLIGNYQQILRPDILAVPTVTTVNFHPSPLPRYAGWAPFFWMVREGELDSGVTAIDVTPEIDGGPVIMQKPIRLTGHETALEVRESHTMANVALLRQLLPRLIAREYTTSPQVADLRSYFSKPEDRDYWLDFTQPSAAIARTVRAGYRRPGAYVSTDRGDQLTILTVEDVGRKFPEPDAPGMLRVESGAVYAASRDGWLRLWSIDVKGEERLARVPDGTARFDTRFQARGDI